MGALEMLHLGEKIAEVLGVDALLAALLHPGCRRWELDGGGAEDLRDVVEPRGLECGGIEGFASAAAWTRVRL